MNSFLYTQSQRWDRIISKFSLLDTDPEPHIIDFLNGRYGQLGIKGIDIGCGFGRHSLIAAKQGYDITSVDFSQKALEKTNLLFNSHGFSAKTILASMDNLLFDSDSFDFNICWCVLNHGTKSLFYKSLSESFRILKKGGVSIGLVMSKEDSRFGKGNYIEKDCYMFDQGLEKGICHYFPTYERLFTVLKSFGDIIELEGIFSNDDALISYHPELSISAHILYVVKKH